MLNQLRIKNIAIADNVDIDWQPGMTTVTGETGAGKSILLNSLNLALGERADSSIVRFGESRAEVSAVFNIQRIDAARSWLVERELDNEDECILRRTVSSEGRSRAFINGQPVPLTELKALGQLLMDIHSQHAHQSLLNEDTHLALLDDFAGHSSELAQLKEAWTRYQGVKRKLEHLQSAAAEAADRRQLLEYQAQEIADLALDEAECEALEAEFKRMTKSESLLSSGHAAMSLLSCDDSPDGLSLVKQALNQLQSIEDEHPSLANAVSLADSALIQLQEATADLDDYLNSFEFDAERRAFVEDRLNQIHTLARKHHIPSEQLREHGEALQNELENLDQQASDLTELEASLEALKNRYTELAMRVSTKRKKAATLFAKAITERLAQLAMPHARFEVDFQTRKNSHSSGIDQVGFRVSLNPGMPVQPLGKVASGGELSRISLAIQVICAEHSTIPTLVFDEVDVGISGATAEIVGHMLRTVGQKGQVICVTHQPQVAALGHQHCTVEKVQEANHTTTNIRTLSAEQRIDELARMLGGIDITKQTRAHAREMLRTEALAH